MAGRDKEGRITIRTVAADAGVSVAAVSKVLRNAYGISRELRSKVEASVARLGYRPRPAARAMRGKTYTLGVLLPDIRNPFFSDILDGVNAALERTQYRALLGISQSATSIETAVVDLMVDWQMDGVIMVGPRMTPAEMAAVAERIPMVAVGHHEPQALTFDSVNNDDRHGGELVVEHLAGAGRKRIACFSLDVPILGEVGVTGQREAGYLEAVQRAGLAQYRRVIQAGQTSREIQLTVKHLLQEAPRPDAIFCWTDFVAFEVLSVVRELGLAVPGDVALVGYDNTRDCELVQHSLTSVDQSGQVLGLQAARLLIERIKGRDRAEHFVVTPRLVVRSSSARPRP
jgi:LacI family transcriptional regulator